MLTIYHDGFLVCIEQCLKKIKNEMINHDILFRVFEKINKL